MIKTTQILRQELKQYRDPQNKIARMVKAGELIPIVRGLYETDPTVSGHLLAASIYGPSYLSFEFALSWHGLIPEAVYNYTSATFGKKKKKSYRNAFGLYLFRDVPINVFRFGLEIRYENDYPFLIAGPEKAICDKLYTVPPVNNQKDILELLFDDIRIDENDFWDLNIESMIHIANLYQTTNHRLLIKVLERNVCLK